MSSYEDKLKKKKIKKASFSDRVISGNYESTFSKNNANKVQYKEIAPVKANNTEKLRTTTLMGNSQFNSARQNTLPHSSFSPVKRTVEDIAPVKKTTFTTNNEGYTETGKKYGNYYYDDNRKGNYNIYAKDGKFFYYDEKNKKYEEITKNTGVSFQTADSMKKNRKEAEKKYGYKGTKKGLTVLDQLKLDTSDLTKEEYKEYSKDLQRQQKDKEEEYARKNRVRTGGAGFKGSLGELETLFSNTVGNIDDEIVEPIRDVGDNYKVGKITEKMGMEAYKKMMGEENEYDETKREYEKYAKFNEDIVNQPNYLDQSMQSLPNQVGGLVAGVKGGGIGSGIGAFAGGIIGGLGTRTIEGAIIGAKTGAKWLGRGGYVAGQAEYTYKLEAGLQYQTLIDMGVPEDIAKEEAKDTGAINALIESGESIADLVTFGGISKVKTALTKDLVKKYGEEAVTNWVGKTVAQNIVTEAGEESTQEYVSIRNEKQALERAGIEREATWKDDLKRIKESAIVGGMSGGMSTAVTSIATGTIKAGINTANNKAVESNINTQIDAYEKETGVKLTVEERKQLINETKAEINNILSKQQEQQFEIQGNEVAQQEEKPFVYEVKDTDSVQRKELAKSTDVLKDNEISRELFELTSKVAEDTGTIIRFTNNTKPEMIAEQDRFIKNYAKNQNISVEEAREVVKDLTIDGFVNENNELIVNVDSDKALNVILGHETTHLFEGMTKEYKALQDSLFKLAETKGELTQMKEAMQILYEGTNANIDNEITSELAGKYLFTDQDFINNLSAEQPNVFKQVYDYIKHLYNTVTAGTKEARQLEEVKYRYEQAYKKFSKATTQETKTNSTTEADSNTKNKTKYELSENNKEIQKMVREIEKVSEQDIIKDQYIDELIYDSKMYQETNDYDEVYGKLMEALEKEGITPRYDSKKDRYVYDRQELAVKGYNELLDYLDKKKVNYEISKSTEAGYVPSIYIKDSDGDTVFRIANHDNGYVDDFDMVYSDKYNTLFDDRDYINWKENIVPKLEREGIFEQEVKYALTLSESNKTTDNNGKKLTKKQQDFFKDSKAVDENGLVTVYHTMTDTGEQFNEFNPVGTTGYRFGEQVVNYYTDSKEMSGSYADQEYNMADTKKLKSFEEVNKWLEKNNNRLAKYKVEQDNGKYILKQYPDLSFVHDSATGEIKVVREWRTKKTYNSLESLLRNVKKDTNESISKYQYEGYVNLTNPYIIDARNKNWDNVSRTPETKKIYVIESLNSEQKNELNKLALESEKLHDDYRKENKGKFYLLQNAYDELSGSEQYEVQMYGLTNELSNKDKKILVWNDDQSIREITLEQFAEEYTKAVEERNKFRYPSTYFASKYQEIANYGEIEAEELFNVALNNFDFTSEELKSRFSKSNTTNDVVKQVIEMNNNGSNYDGVIIYNVYDYGGYTERQAPADLYVTFNSNQFKAVDNTKPTNDPDIRYSLSDKKVSIGNKEYQVEEDGEPRNNLRAGITNVRGGWNYDKIQKELKNMQSPVASLKDFNDYDSMEDLINHLYYHGSTSLNRHLKAGSTLPEQYRTGGYGEAYHTISLSKERNTASNFSSMGQSGVVEPVLLKKGAKVITMEDIEDSIELEADYENILPELWDKGIDAVKTDFDKTEQELIVLNPHAIATIPEGALYYKNYKKPKFENLTEQEIRDLFEKKRLQGIEDNKYELEHLEEMYSDEAKRERIRQRNEQNIEYFNNQKLKFSLSKQNEDIAPTGNYNIYGKDVRLQQQVKEAIAPLQEEVKRLNDKITTLTEDMAPVSQDVVEQEATDSLNSMTDEDMPTNEGQFTFNDETPVVKKKLDIEKDLMDTFGISRNEAKTLYDRIANYDYITPDDAFNELQDYRKVKMQEENDYYKDIKRDIKGTRLDISDIKGQITDYGNSYRMSNMGKGLILGNSGQKVDSFYQELNEKYPDVFPDTITAEADQLETISDFLYKDTKFEYTYNLDDDDLYSLAKNISADIGNKERDTGSKRHLHFLKKAVMDMLPPGETGAVNSGVTYEEYLKSLPDILPDNYAPYLEMAREVNASNTEKTIENVSIKDELNRLGVFIPESTNEATIKQNPILEAIRNRVPRKNKPSISKAWDTFYSHQVNRNLYTDRLAKKENNPEIKYKGDRVNNIYGEIGGDIFKAQTDNEGNAIGDALDKPFAIAREKGLDKYFNDYLINLSNIERHAQGKGSNVDLGASQEIVKAYEEKYPIFKELREYVYKYNHNQLNNGQDNGLLNKEFKDRLIDMYGKYVPFYSDTEVKSLNMSPDEIRSSRPIKYAEGGANQDTLLSVEQAMIKQTVAWKSQIVKNDFYKEIGKTIGKKVELGADVRDNPLSTEDSLYADEKGKYLTYYDEGKRQTVMIDDDLYNELSRGLEKQIRDIAERYGKFSEGLATISRVRGEILTTYNPMFAVRNILMDPQEALINTKYLGKYVSNALQGVSIQDSYKANHLQEYAQEFKNITGLNINEVTDSNSLSGKAKSLYKKYQDGATWNRFITSYGTGATRMEYQNGEMDINSKKRNFILRGIERFNNFAEVMNRYPEFKATLQKGGTFTEALYNAREVTTNFGRGGTIAKAVNRYGATFYNTSVQGMDKFIRNFSGQNGARGFIGAVSKAVMLGMAPALLNDLLFGGDDDDKDEDYEALPDYVKDNFYLFKMDNGEFIRIPKGRMISVLGSTARRTLEYMQGEEDAFNGYWGNAKRQIVASNPLKENIVAPIRQAKLFNKEDPGETWYGTELVPKRLQDKPAKEQYDETTDKFSIWLGKKTGLSPYKLNYLIDQYSGGIGDIFLPMMTEEATSDADTFGEQLLAPFKDQFKVDSTSDNKYVTDFYTKQDELELKSNSSQATDEDLLKSKYIKSISYKMGELYAERREVQNDDSLTKSEKYKKAQAIKDQINSLAKEGLDNYQSLNKTSNYAMIGDQEYYLNANNEWYSPDEEELDTINAFGMDIEEKSSYFNAKNEIYTMNNEYRELLDNASDEEKDSIYAQKKKDIIDVIKNTNLNDFGKAYLYDKQYGDTETLDTIIAVDIDMDSYLDFEAQSFTADKNKYGKTISGSKKKKVFDYINSMDLGFEQKVILAKMQYKTYNEYNYEIIDYLNNNPNLDYDYEVKILRELGFKVSDDGTITW